MKMKQDDQAGNLAEISIFGKDGKPVYTGNMLLDGHDLGSVGTTRETGLHIAMRVDDLKEGLHIMTALAYYHLPDGRGGYASKTVSRSVKFSVVYGL